MREDKAGLVLGEFFLNEDLYLLESIPLVWRQGYAARDIALTIRIHRQQLTRHPFNTDDNQLLTHLSPPWIHWRRARGEVRARHTHCTTIRSRSSQG